MTCEVVNVYNWEADTQSNIFKNHSSVSIPLKSLTNMVRIQLYRGAKCSAF